MLTWLDAWVRGALDRLDALPISIRESNPPATDLEAGFLLSRALLKGMVRVDKMKAKDSRIEQRDMVMLGAMLMLFTAPDAERQRELARLQGGITLAPTCRGIQMDARLTRALSNARTPERADYARHVCGVNWYIDIPHKTILMDSATQVRALFVKGTGGAGGIFCLAVLTHPGKNEITGLVVWAMDTAEIAGHTDVPLADVRERLADFVRLAILYAASVEGQAHSEPLPRLDNAAQARLSLKKQRAKHNSASLFKISRLVAPAGNFGRGESAGAWTLTSRIQVRGHFRWQACGKGRAQHKLIWIDDHIRGPEDARLKPELLIIQRG